MGAGLDVVLNLWMLVDAGQFDQVPQLLTPDAEFRSRGAPVGGWAEIRPFWEGSRTAFPDLRREVLDYVETPDAVCVEVRATGTNTGPLSSTTGGQVPPTGRAVSFESIDLIRLQGGKIRSWHDQHDQLQLLQALGMLG